MVIVKSQIEKRLADMNPGIIRKDIDKIIEIILLEITASLRKGMPVEIRGFGRFSTKVQKSRIGRNPRDGTKVQVPEKIAIKWKCSRVLLKELNKNFTENKISDSY